MFQHNKLTQLANKCVWIPLLDIRVDIRSEVFVFDSYSTIVIFAYPYIFFWSPGSNEINGDRVLKGYFISLLRFALYCPFNRQHFTVLTRWRQAGNYLKVTSAISGVRLYDFYCTVSTCNLTYGTTWACVDAFTKRKANYRLQWTIW